jgi:hypothetical protein
MRLAHSSGLLVVELASLWCYLLLGGGMPSMGLSSLHLLTATSLLKRVVGIQSQRRQLGWNHHHGLSGRSILDLWCGCDGSGRSPRAASPGGEEAEAPHPTRCHEELLGGVLSHGSQRGRCLAVSSAHEGGA